MVIVHGCKYRHSRLFQFLAGYDAHLLKSRVDKADLRFCFIQLGINKRYSDGSVDASALYLSISADSESCNRCYHGVHTTFVR